MCDSGVYTDPSKITFEQYAQTWLEVYVRPRVRPKTYKSYVYAINTLVIPDIGMMKLAELTPTRVQKLINTLAEKYAASAVEKARQVIHMTYKQARIDGLVKTNPTENIKMPKASKKIIPAVPADDIAVALANWRRTRYGIAIPLLLHTGLRVGELLALTWDDINLDAKILVVSKTQYDLKIDDGPFTFHVGEPKTPGPAAVSRALCKLLKSEVYQLCHLAE